MTDLNTLIEKYGEPDALIDHWDPLSQAWAIWGFEEIYSLSTEDIQKGFEEDLLNPLQEKFDVWKAGSDSLAAVGFLSYDLKNFLFPHLNFKPVNTTQPLAWFAKPSRAIPYRQSKNLQSSKTPILSHLADIPTPSSYKNSINKIKHYLEEGQSYQINFTQPKSYRLPEDPFKTFLHIREFNQPHYGMYLNTGTTQILSFSPERFFKTQHGLIESFPMKGTRPRSENEMMDAKLYEDLKYSTKDKAEHLMIVDLLRNDLGKITNYGSVSVDNLYHIKSFDSVHQMESRVYGSLRETMNETNIFTALFPGGSITGAPKERSMEIIDSLEKYNRRIYTGAIGSISSNGDMDFNIAIRTMTVENGIGIYPVGGGIVWDSDPLEEWREAQGKSGFLTPFTHPISENLSKGFPQKVIS